ncbi:putative phosphoprotein [Wheat yellow striate virus]|uniref:Putative phosphoprotein n=1 Tax=Wheat yellow striate virus TaxID=2152660 RepID=A0A2R4K2I5_9RHAB|nr:putative phosphoprotein [Wheat yellow striate virus]AVV48076.1 putative phosphoprotein [Wheat yellow striate virus]
MADSLDTDRGRTTRSGSKLKAQTTHRVGTSSGSVRGGKPYEKDFKAVEARFHNFDPISASIIRGDQEGTKADLIMSDSSVTKATAPAEAAAPPPPPQPAAVPLTPPASATTQGQKRPGDPETLEEGNAAKRVQRANKVNNLLTTQGIGEPSKSAISQYVVARLNANNVEHDDAMVAECANMAVYGWKEGKKFVSTQILNQATTVIPDLITSMVTNANLITNAANALNSIPDKVAGAIRTNIEHVAFQTGSKATKRDTLVRTAESIYQNAAAESKVDFINNFIISAGINIQEVKRNVANYRTIANAIIKRNTVLNIINETTEHQALLTQVQGNKDDIRNIARGLSASYVI